MYDPASPELPFCIVSGSGDAEVLHVCKMWSALCLYPVSMRQQTHTEVGRPRTEVKGANFGLVTGLPNDRGSSQFPVVMLIFLNSLIDFNRNRSREQKSI